MENTMVKFIFEKRMQELKLEAFIYELIDHYEIKIYPWIDDKYQMGTIVIPAPNIYNVYKWMSSDLDDWEIVTEIINILKRTNPEIFL